MPATTTEPTCSHETPAIGANGHSAVYGIDHPNPMSLDTVGPESGAGASGAAFSAKGCACALAQKSAARHTPETGIGAGLIAGSLCASGPSYIASGQLPACGSSRLQGEGPSTLTGHVRQI